MWFYVDGRFVEEAEAKVPVTDRAFLYGDACFESLGVWSGRVIHLEDSLARLKRSARMMRICLPDVDELREAVLETAARNGMQDLPFAYLRLQVTRGTGLGVVVVDGPSTLVVIPRVDGLRDPLALVPLRAALSTYVRAGAAALDPRIKSANYGTSVLAYLEAARQGADLAILRDERGYVAEGQTMNLFCVRDGVIRTPFEASALGGITRAHVLKAARGTGYECAETPVTIYDFECADEAFATSSMDGIMPRAGSAAWSCRWRRPAPSLRL